MEQCAEKGRELRHVLQQKVKTLPVPDSARNRPQIETDRRSRTSHFGLCKIKKKKNQKIKTAKSVDNNETKQASQEAKHRR